MLLTTIKIINMPKPKKLKDQNQTTVEANAKEDVIQIVQEVTPTEDVIRVVQEVTPKEDAIQEPVLSEPLLNEDLSTNTVNLSTEDRAELVRSMSLEDLEQTLKDRKAKLANAAAYVNGAIYEFPYNKPAIKTSLALAVYFCKENLKVGQIFTMNWTKFPFLFLDKLGVELRLEEPFMIYKGNISPEQVDEIVENVRLGHIFLGKFTSTHTPIVEQPILVNCKFLLEMSYDELLTEIKDLITKPIKVNTDSTVHSPMNDIDALIAYEASHEKRPNYVKMLSDAKSKMQGFVEFIKFEEKKKEVKDINIMSEAKFVANIDDDDTPEANVFG